MRQRRLNLVNRNVQDKLWAIKTNGQLSKSEREKIIRNAIHDNRTEDNHAKEANGHELLDGDDQPTFNESRRKEDVHVDIKAIKVEMRRDGQGDDEIKDHVDEYNKREIINFRI